MIIFINFVEGLFPVWAKHTVDILLFTNMLSIYLYPKMNDLFTWVTSIPLVNPSCTIVSEGRGGDLAVVEGEEGRPIKY